MTQFKVGDKVRRITTDNSWEADGKAYTLPVGAVCTVLWVQVGREGAWLSVDYPEWPKDLRCHVGYFELVERFSAPATSAPQQRAIAGGLQKHSVGGSYPIVPVAYANGGQVHWQVENLQTGEALGYPTVCMYTSAAEACAAIDLVTDPAAGPAYWVPQPLPSTWRRAPVLPASRPLTPREQYQDAMDKQVDHV